MSNGAVQDFSPMSQPRPPEAYTSKITIHVRDGAILKKRTKDWFDFEYLRKLPIAGFFLQQRLTTQIWYDHHDSLTVQKAKSFDIFFVSSCQDHALFEKCAHEAWSLLNRLILVKYLSDCFMETSAGTFVLDESKHVEMVDGEPELCLNDRYCYWLL
jgi:hypothetical protein